MLSGTIPVVGRSSSDGFRPTVPQTAEGMRTEPPVSVPTDAKHIPSTSATAEPPLDPPGDRERIARVPHRPERGLFARRAERKLVQVGLADDDGACLAQARRRGRVM